MSIDYSMIIEAVSGNWSNFQKLKEEIHDHVKRGRLTMESLSLCDRNILVGMYIECLDKEDKYYFLTENKNSEEFMASFTHQLMKETKNTVNDFFEEMAELAFNYHCSHLDEIFDQVIYDFNAENNDNSNHISHEDGYYDSEQYVYGEI